MRVGVVGAGAIGGLLASRLERAGHAVSVLARGRTLETLRVRGLRVVEGEDVHDTRPVVGADAAQLGPQDLLVIAVKAPSLARTAASLVPMIGPETLVLPAMNGVPWWFVDPPLTAVDPEGQAAASLPLERTLGCVVHLASAATAPGVVHHTAGWRLVVGEPTGGTSERVAALVAALVDAGFEAEQSDDVRREIWYKLWGNMTVNPVSALTGATGDLILADDLVRASMVRAMAEAAEVGARIGCPIEQSGEERLSLATRLGAFRTSMLQDAEAGRELELDALTGVVRELGGRVGVPTPYVDALHGLTRLMGRVAGTYPA